MDVTLENPEIVTIKVSKVPGMLIVLTSAPKFPVCVGKTHVSPLCKNKVPPQEIGCFIDVPKDKMLLPILSAPVTHILEYIL